MFVIAYKMGVPVALEKTVPLCKSILSPAPYSMPEANFKLNERVLD